MKKWKGCFPSSYENFKKKYESKINTLKESFNRNDVTILKDKKYLKRDNYIRSQYKLLFPEMTEIIEYDKEWENRLIEFSEEVKKMEHEINNKHSDDINEIKQLFEEKHNKKKVKFSKNYFELKSQQMNLVKQQLYILYNLVLKRLRLS